MVSLSSHHSIKHGGRFGASRNNCWGWAVQTFVAIALKIGDDGVDSDGIMKTGWFFADVGNDGR